MNACIFIAESRKNSPNWANIRAFFSPDCYFFRFSASSFQEVTNYISHQPSDLIHPTSFNHISLAKLRISENNTKQITVFVFIVEQK